MIRGLSLTQPWATLVAIGAKEWETRSWSTPYRGQVAIHASKSYPRWARECEREELFSSALGDRAGRLPTGSIIALATIEECRPATFTPLLPELVDFSPSQSVGFGAGELSYREYVFGDFGLGRYAWRIANVLELPTPIPCKGALGLWTLPDGVIAQIYDALLTAQRTGRQELEQLRARRDSLLDRVDRAERALR